MPALNKRQWMVAALLVLLVAVAIFLVVYLKHRQKPIGTIHGNHDSPGGKSHFPE